MSDEDLSDKYTQTFLALSYIKRMRWIATETSHAVWSALDGEKSSKQGNDDSSKDVKKDTPRNIVAFTGGSIE